MTDISIYLGFCSILDWLLNVNRSCVTCSIVLVTLMRFSESLVYIYLYIVVTCLRVHHIQIIQFNIFVKLLSVYKN